METVNANNNKLSYEIIDDNRIIYTIKFTKNETNIEMLITEKSSLSSTYKTSLEVKNFHEINKFFKQFDDIQEIFEYFCDLEEITENTTITMKNKFAKLNIKLPSISKSKSNNNLLLQIPRIELNEKDLIVELCQQVKKIDILESKMNFLFLSLGKTEKDFYSLLKGIDIVFYLISATNASNKDMVLEFEQNVLPVIRLLEACKKYSVRFVFFSSGGTVYGLPKYVPIDEMHSTDPISPYGIHKLTLEKCIEYYGRTYGLDYLILRITNPYGMYQNPKKNQGAIAVFLAKAILGNTIEIWGDGNAVRDYIFVSDVMDACDALMHYQGKKIFNISSGRGYSLNEIVTEIYRQLRNRPIRVRYLPMRIQDVSVSILDNTLIGQETSWKPKINLQEGIRQMIKMWNPVTNKFDYGGS